MNKKKPFKIIDLDFIVLELYEYYVISTIQEGVVFDFPHLRAVYDVFEKYYNGKTFVSIAKRIYDYTVNPTCYMKPLQTANILGVAVVCKSESAYNTALFEKKFSKKHFEPFYTLEEAIDWSKELVKNYNKNAGL